MYIPTNDIKDKLLNCLKLTVGVPKYPKTNRSLHDLSPMWHGVATSPHLFAHRNPLLLGIPTVHGY